MVKNVSSLLVQVYVRKSTGEKLVVNQNMTLRKVIGQAVSNEWLASSF